jgi:DNA-binding PadR family transcriptional regulator
MSIRHGILGVLSTQPTHGYGIKTQFEASTGGVWPLNVGQVYTTLTRLERDGLVQCLSSPDDEIKNWKITKSGEAALTSWFRTPVDESQLRDELTIKILFAIVAQSVDIRAVIQNQRSAALAKLQLLTKRKRDSQRTDSLVEQLLLESQIIKIEAEVKWLDFCETKLLKWQKERGK